MKKKGFVLILSAIVVLIILIYISAGQKKENNMDKSTAVSLTAPPATVTTEEPPEATKMPNQEEAGEEKENLSTGIEILDLPEEARNILNVSQERLTGELKIYLNSVGYATVDTVHYAGEITIDHLEKTVIVGFYIQEEGLYQFNLIYDRAKKTYNFEQW